MQPASSGMSGSFRNGNQLRCGRAAAAFSGVEQAVQRRCGCVSGVKTRLRIRTASAVTTTLPVENWRVGEFPEWGFRQKPLVGYKHFKHKQEKCHSPVECVTVTCDRRVP